VTDVGGVQLNVMFRNETYTYRMPLQ